MVVWFSTKIQCSNNDNWLYLFVFCWSLQFTNRPVFLWSFLHGRHLRNLCWPSKCRSLGRNPSAAFFSDCTGHLKIDGMNFGTNLSAATMTTETSLSFLIFTITTGLSFLWYFAESWRVPHLEHIVFARHRCAVHSAGSVVVLSWFIALAIKIRWWRTLAPNSVEQQWQQLLLNVLGISCFL